MGNKIIVEFDKKSLLKNCELQIEMNSIDNTLLECVKCKKTDKDLVWCALFRIHIIKFKIKEQSNGNKGTED